MAIEHTILSNLVLNEIYSRKVLAYIKSEYFLDNVEKTIFEKIEAYVGKYNGLPSKEALYVELDTKTGLSDEEDKHARDYIESLATDEKNLDWLVTSTEQFCKDKALIRAISAAFAIVSGSDKKNDKGIIPDMMAEALAVSFDTHLGHDYIEDAPERYDELHRKERRIPFDIEFLNKITNGGLPPKTLNVIVAGINVGKTMMMCHMAAYNLLSQRDVLYITLEMGEKEIGQRIDVNLMNIAFDEYNLLPKDIFLKQIERIRKKSGKLLIKEYPTSQASSANFRHLLHELKMKHKFVPSIIYVDYINLCLSARIKYTAISNTYLPVKAIGEELRGLAVEFNVPIVTGTQLTRGGLNNSDPGMSDTAESIGLPAVADWQIAAIETEEFAEKKQFLIKQLKNRYASKIINKRFVVGVDKNKQRLYDVEQVAQEGIVEPDEAEVLKYSLKFDEFK